MKNKSLAVAKINFRNMKLACVITIITILCVVIQDIVNIILEAAGVSYGAWEGYMGAGNYFYLLILLNAVFIPALNFRKMMNLGAKRNDFFTGCAVTYIIMAAIVSLSSMLLYYTYEHFIISTYDGWTLSVMYWFGWVDNGAVIAFFQQFAFLTLVAAVIHTLTAAQDKWYGWVADIVIIAIISVFTPIAPLRAALVWFFNMIIFTNPFVQIFFCLGLAIVVYSLNKLILARKTI
jgi:hypothetical protein